MDNGAENGASSNNTKHIRQWLNLKNVSDSVDTGIGYAFRRWAYFVCKYPYLVILCTTVFSVIWTAAFALQLKQELDSKDLFTPKNARSFDDKKYVDEVYGSYTDRARVLATLNPWKESSENCQERLLLADEATAQKTVQEFFRLYEEIAKMEAKYDGQIYLLNDICAKASGTDTCLLTSVLDLWNYNATYIKDENFKPLEAINGGNLTNRFELPFDDGYYLGKRKPAECEPNTNLSSNVEAFAMTIIYVSEPEDIDGAEIDPEARAWIEELLSFTREFSKSSILDVYITDENAASKESDDQVTEDIGLLTIGYVLIILYTNVVLFKNNLLACKSHLSIVSVIGIGLALMSGFGMAQTFKIELNMVVQVLPFLILGLGIDDTFVIIGAYQRVDSLLPISERIALTLERAGSSILVTSATDFCAFLMGLNTELPALRAFSAYAALAIFFDFTYQVTFFVAFLVIEARREVRYRNGCPHLGIVPWWKKSPFSEPTKNPEVPPQVQEMTQMNHDAEAVTTDSPSNSKALKKIYGKGDYNPKEPAFSTKLAGQYLASLILHPIGKVVVFLIEGTLIGLAIYGCTKVRMNFNFIKMFVPNDSPLTTGYDIEDDFFYGSQVFFSVYTKEAAGGDYFYHQGELRALKTALEDDHYVVPPVRTWYEGYSEWLESPDFPYGNELENNTTPDAARFNLWLEQYLNTTSGRVFQTSVLFSYDTNRRVISSSINAHTVSVIDGEQSIDIVDSIRDSIENAAPSFDPIPFAESFLFFDGFRVIEEETIRNVVLAGIGVFIMNIIVLASVPMALIVVSMVGLTDLMLFGYMWYVDQYFNPVTAINLVLAVGIAVDYSAHIAHSFLVVTGDRASRAQQALEHIGGEVMSGAFTTWLGIVIMGFAEHYIIQSFFKMFFAIIVFGAWHGLVFLPVVLSLVGSPPYESRRKEIPVAATSNSKS